ncbi:hypothetical protein [Roseisolibacter sp. H3M3-2]|uniref:FG-GAP repeat protein n=1 Tax=Roseisolibacter sp. H3M3-2 TaxID=3031323 RepID=UPI0023DAE1A5|nr:hypothetical protein [Roseisolibacter sp. H3M3-2]MDF1504002.1 hypothetical protein [Roseisolibacter sp. H3M3-2]
MTRPTVLLPLLAALAAACGDRTPAPAPPVAATCDGGGMARTCEVSGLFAGAAAPRLRLATGDAVPDTLRLSLVRADGSVVPLPVFYGSTVWGMCGPTVDARDLPRRDRLAAADVNGDGADDLVVVAECMTGMGATGAHPFPAGAVYLGDGRGGWRSVAAVDSTLTDLAQAACGGADGRPGGGGVAGDVRALARDAVRRSLP